MRSGADSRVPDSSESAGLEVLEERLGPARGRPVNCASPPIHVEEREIRRERVRNEGIADRSGERKRVVLERDRVLSLRKGDLAGS